MPEIGGYCYTGSFHQRESRAQRRRRRQLRALVLAAIASAGCAPALAQVQLGRTAARPDAETVELKVCRGDFDDAHRYLEDRGLSRAEREEWIERARKAVRGKPGCECAAAMCRAEGGR